MKRRKPNSGEKNGLARLTEADVLAIRRARFGLRAGQRMPRNHPQSVSSIAKRFGISPCQVSRIVLRFQWDHI